MVVTLTPCCGSRQASASAIRVKPSALLFQSFTAFTCHSFCTSAGIAFLAEDLLTPIAPARTFSKPDSMLEMIRRGNGLRDLACRQAVDLAIQAGRGNVDLLLTPEQFAKLTGKL